MRKIKDGVYYSNEEIPRIRIDDIQNIKEESSNTELKRARICTHRDTIDKLHEMFIVLSNGTYIRPHKHLNEAESMHIIEGVVDIILFDEKGNITEVIKMGDYSSGKIFYYRIDKPIYHAQIIHSDYLIVHEVTTGPFNKEETMYASWSPDDKDKNAVKLYKEELLIKLNKFLGERK